MTNLEKELIDVLHKILLITKTVSFSHYEQDVSVRPPAVIGRIEGLVQFTLETMKEEKE